jgi:Lon protease-like protein
MLPLHVFEEGYKRMVVDALDTHRMLCVGTRRPEDPKKASSVNPELEKEIVHLLWVGVVRVAVEKPDGSYNLILQGICRARVLDLLEGGPYRRAHLEPLLSSGGSEIRVEDLYPKVQEMVALRSKMGTEFPRNTLKFLNTVNDPGTLSDLVSFTLLEDCKDRQNVMEALDLDQRLKLVMTLLKKEIERLKIVQQIGDALIKKDLDLN